MAFQTLRLLLYIASILIIGVGISFYFLGPNATASLMLESLQIFLPNPEKITDMTAPNVDSELRFFAPFFVAYGVLVFLCAKHLRTHLYYVPHILVVFLIGGLGRALSYITVGEPHPLFVHLMIIEVGLPILLYFLYTRVVAKIIQD